MRERKKFADLVKKGRELSQLWWEDKAKQNMGSNKINTPLWIFNMKNRFGWADKMELAGDKGRPLTIKVVDYSKGK